MNDRPVGRFSGSMQRRFSTKFGETALGLVSPKHVIVVKETGRERKKMKAVNYEAGEESQRAG